MHRAQDRRLKTRGGDLAKGITVDLRQLETLQKELK